MSIRNLLLFCIYLSRKDHLGKAGFLGCFIQIFLGEIFIADVVPGSLGVLFARCANVGQLVSLFGFRFSIIN
jgi:hypothetical protein